jgi:hypothetical protein
VCATAQVCEKPSAAGLLLLSPLLPSNQVSVDLRLCSLPVIRYEVVAEVGKLRPRRSSCPRKEVSEKRGLVVRMTDSSAEQWRSQFIYHDSGTFCAGPGLIAVSGAVRSPA